MKSADEIRQLFKNAELGIDPDADEKVFKDVLRAQQETTEKVPAVPEIWRIIMKSPFTKIAVAAVLVIACLTSVLMLNGTSGVAWAIEQSIEAVNQYKAILLEGWDSDGSWREGGSLQLRPFKAWAVANEDQTMVKKYRHEADGVAIITTNGQKTWRYDPNTYTVHVENRPYVASECWIGGQFLEQLKDLLESDVLSSWEVTYGKDPVTSKQRAYLTCAWLDKRYNGPRSTWFEFDVDSKLLVSLKQWENANWEGQPALIGDKITYYESLPDELFEFEIPEGAIVIEH